MMKISIQFKFFLIILSSSLLLSCSGGTSVAGGDNFPSIIPEDPTAGYDTDNFFIAVRNISEVTSHSRTVGSFNTQCEIAEGSANQDLSCIIDIPEGDLYVKGLELIYNVPPNMCRYLARMPYWYYNNEVGYGPTDVSITTTLDVSGNITGSVCNINGIASTPCNPALYPDLVFKTTATDITTTCVYNRGDVSEPNCCFGDYTLTRTVNRPGGIVETDSTLESWGDPEVGMKSCLGGTGRTNWTKYSRSGFPAYHVDDAEEGISSTYELPAPINNPNTGRNVPVANYFTPAVTHAHTSFGTILTSQQPYFIEPITDRSGTSMASGNDSYEFRCLDEAYEVRHRIRVYVREWDAFSDYLTYIATSGVTEAPDRPLDDDLACSGLVDNCNDFSDSDDYPAFLQTILIPPTNEYYDQAGEEARRIFNFPRDRYESN